MSSSLKITSSYCIALNVSAIIGFKYDSNFVVFAPRQSTKIGRRRRRHTHLGHDRSSYGQPSENSPSIDNSMRRSSSRLGNGSCDGSNGSGHDLTDNNCGCKNNLHPTAGRAWWRKPNERSNSSSPTSSTTPKSITSSSQMKRRRKNTTGKFPFGNCSLALLLLIVLFVVGLIVFVMSATTILPSIGIPGRNSIRAVQSYQQNQMEPFEKVMHTAPQCRSITADAVSFTLVTQLSIDRLWMMRYHCERWGDSSPISVAVLTNQTTLQTRESLLRLGCAAAQLTVQTLEINDELKSDYPVNVLRQMALSAVQTTHVMYVDIDFWEAKDLHDTLILPHVREALAMDPKRALVVPAFQINRQCREYVDCRQKNIPRMPLLYKDMMDVLLERKGLPFDPTNRGGHGSTLYSHWIKNPTPGALVEIPCIRSNRYEPYMAFRYCRDLPPFQTHFSGYGKNKMTWVMQLRRSGYLFSQLGGVFVVHYPHLDSESRMQWNQAPKELQPFEGEDGKLHKFQPGDVKLEDWTAYKRGRVDAMFVKFKNWLLTDITDESRVRMCDDSEDDDVKLWIHRPS